MIAFAKLGVAGFAQLADLRRTLWVDGDWGWRCTRGCFDVEERAMEGVEGGKLGVEGVAGGVVS